MSIEALIDIVEKKIEWLEDNISWIKEESRWSGQADIDQIQIQAHKLHLSDLKFVLKSLKEIQSQNVLVVGDV